MAVRGLPAGQRGTQLGTWQARDLPAVHHTRKPRFCKWLALCGKDERVGLDCSVSAGSLVNVVDFGLQAPEERRLLAAAEAAVLGGFPSRAGLPALKGRW